MIGGGFPSDIPACGDAYFGYYSPYKRDLIGQLFRHRTVGGAVVEITHVSPCCPRCYDDGSKDTIFVAVVTSDEPDRVITLDEEICRFLEPVDGDKEAIMANIHRLETVTLLASAGAKPSRIVKSVYMVPVEAN